MTKIKSALTKVIDQHVRDKIVEEYIKLHPETYDKLTMLASGYTPFEIADKYDMSPTNVYRLRKKFKVEDQIRVALQGFRH